MDFCNILRLTSGIWVKPKISPDTTWCVFNDTDSVSRRRQIRSHFNLRSCLHHVQSHVSAVHLFRLPVYFGDNTHVNTKLLPHKKALNKQKHLSPFSKLVGADRAALWTVRYTHTHIHAYTRTPLLQVCCSDGPLFPSHHAGLSSVLSVLFYVPICKSYLLLVFVM